MTGTPKQIEWAKQIRDEVAPKLQAIHPEMDRLLSDEDASKIIDGPWRHVLDGRLDAIVEQFTVLKAEVEVSEVSLWRVDSLLGLLALGVTYTAEGQHYVLTIYPSGASRPKRTHKASTGAPIDPVDPRLEREIAPSTQKRRENLSGWLAI